MLVLDSVICDLCGQGVGKLYGLPSAQADLLDDLRVSPHFTVCPDCRSHCVAVDSAEPLSLEARP